MGFIEDVSKDTSEKLGNRINKTEEEKKIIQYGLFIIIHTSLAIILTFVVGILTNMVLEIMIISIVAAWMKRYSGGVHASTPNRCLIIGIILSLTLSILDKKIIIFLENDILVIALLLGTLLSYITLYYKCPIGSKNKPLKKEATRKKLRKKAFNLMNFYSVIMLIGIYIYIKEDIYILKSIVSCICLGLTLQILVLTKLGNEIILLLDSTLEKLKIS
jgi:accessory gene regulator B